MSKKPKFELRRIKMCNAHGETTCEPAALCYKGVAVHTAVQGSDSVRPEWLASPQFVLTHIGTGLKFGYIVGTMDKAQELAVMLADRYHIGPNESVRTARGKRSLKNEIIRLQKMTSITPDNPTVGLHKTPVWLIDNPPSPTTNQALLHK